MFLFISCKSGPNELSSGQVLIITISLLLYLNLCIILLIFCITYTQRKYLSNAFITCTFASFIDTSYEDLGCIHTVTWAFPPFWCSNVYVFHVSMTSDEGLHVSMTSHERFLGLYEVKWRFSPWVIWRFPTSQWRHKKVSMTPWHHMKLSHFLMTSPEDLHNSMT